MTTASAFAISFALAAASVVLALILDVAGRPRIATLITGAGLLAAGGVGMYAGWTVPVGVALGGFAAGQGFSAIPGFVFLLAGSAIMFGGDSRGRSVSASALIGLAALGAGLAVASRDLVTLLLAIETTAICGYALVSIARTAESSEAAMKYLIQGAVASAVYVAGLAATLAFVAPTGGYQDIYVALSGALGGSGAATVGALMLLAAMAFKSGVAPFHSWAPDAYQTAPFGSSAFLAGAVKLASVTALVLVVSSFASAGLSPEVPLGTTGSDVLPVIAALAAISIIVGSFTALRQTSYARMLAYAGIAQVGYSLLALAALNATAAILQVTAYAVATTGAYLAIGAFRTVRPDWDGSITGLAGLGRTSKLLGVSLVGIMASLAGIPPFVGFWGKFQSLAAAVFAASAFAADYPVVASIYAVLVVVGVVGAVVSLGYYGSVLRSLYFDSVQGDEPAVPAGGSGAALFAIAVLAMGVAPFIVGVGAALAGLTLR